MTKDYLLDQPPVKGELSSTLYAFLDCLKNLTKQRGYCWPTNAFLAKQFKCTERTVTRRLSILVDEGHIRISYRNGERHIRIVPDHKPQKTKRGTAKKGEAAVIAPIETQYKGYRFRSRLEARWAVFFDVCGIKWEYEKEGFNLGNKCYLPDFYLSDKDLWCEIKPNEVLWKECDYAYRLCELTKQSVVVIMGEPALDKDIGVMCGGEVFHWMQADQAYIQMALDDPDYFGGREAVQKMIDQKGKVVPGCILGTLTFTMDKTIGHERALKALEAFRSARFEFGETPVIEEPVEDTIRRVIQQELRKANNN